jgi:flavin-binding protein dodecin
VKNDAVYRKTEIVGTSPAGIEAAISNGLTRARKTLRNLDWFEVTEIRGYLGQSDGQDVDYYQVSMKVGFRVDD